VPGLRPSARMTIWQSRRQYHLRDVKRAAEANAMAADGTLAMIVGICNKHRGDHPAEYESLAA